MKHFKELTTFFNFHNDVNLSNYYIIGVQHLLDTTGSLIEKIIEQGVPAQNIFLTGKLYSTNSDVKSKLKILGINLIDSNSYQKPGHFKKALKMDVMLLWNKLWQTIPKNKTIIILDDGGYAIKNIPKEIIDDNHKIIGIEQTTSGVWGLENCTIPVINVAQSAVKKIIEPYLISKTLHFKINEALEQSKAEIIGIAGFGNIGKSIALNLLPKYKVYVFDIDKNKTKDCIEFFVEESCKELFNSCDVIIGCTGKDISDIDWLNSTNRNKLLISASSADTEFNTLLKEYSRKKQSQYPLDNLELKTHSGHTITLYRGGTVANFDGSPFSVPTNEIQLTRGLLYAAFIQGLELDPHSVGLIALNAQYQKKVLDLWFENHPEFKKYYESNVLKEFDSIDWIKTYS
jgi:S-adenosylhomocysteine hydrolase